MTTEDLRVLLGTRIESVAPADAANSRDRFIFQRRTTSSRRYMERDVTIELAGEGQGPTITPFVRVVRFVITVFYRDDPDIDTRIGRDLERIRTSLYDLHAANGDVFAVDVSDSDTRDGLVEEQVEGFMTVAITYSYTGE